MAGSLFEEDDEITAINVTPLVDVMLVLLIIFMVTTTYIVQRSIFVSLPKAKTAQQKVTAKSLGFVIDLDGQLYLDGTATDFSELPQVIRNLKKAKKTTKFRALISADKRTPHGVVVNLIDVIRQNGIVDFAINVEVVR
jgi:biopolymer transport protein ExbD